MCRRVELAKRKERSEAHLYLTVSVYTEDDFSQHQGIDLVDFDNVKRSPCSNYHTIHVCTCTSINYIALCVCVCLFPGIFRY